MVTKGGTDNAIPELPFGDDAVPESGADTELPDRHTSERSISSKESLHDESEQQLAPLNGSLRVKHHLSHICFVHRGYACVREGFYSGALDDTGDMHGNGVFWFAATDDVYLGEFCHGELHGVGALSIRINEAGARQRKQPKHRILKGHWEHNEFMGEEILS